MGIHTEKMLSDGTCDRQKHVWSMRDTGRVSETKRNPTYNLFTVAWKSGLDGCDHCCGPDECCAIQHDETGLIMISLTMLTMRRLCGWRSSRIINLGALFYQQQTKRVNPLIGTETWHLACWRMEGIAVATLMRLSGSLLSIPVCRLLDRNSRSTSSRNLGVWYSMNYELWRMTWAYYTRVYHRKVNEFAGILRGTWYCTV